MSAQCQLAVAFEPGTATGFEAARLQLTDNASATPHAVSLVAHLADCKLPIVVQSASGGLQGKFLSVLAGDATGDPNGGQSPISYDRARGRWLPVYSTSVSPDGALYAYVDYNNQFQMHVVDVSTGRDRTLNIPSSPWSVLAFTREGIYAHIAYEGIASGLSLVDPDSGAMRQLFGDSPVQAVADGAAWLGVLNHQDPHPPVSAMGGDIPNQIVRRDLATGQNTTWLYRPGTAVYVAGVAGGRLLVNGYDDQGSARYWIVSGPNQADPLVAPESGDPLSYISGVVADAQGIWVGASGGIYLWTQRAGAVLVSDLVARPAGSCA